MPAPRGESAIIKRLAALLGALSAEYASWEELIIAAGCYEHLSEESASLLRPQAGAGLSQGGWRPMGAARA